MIRTSLSRLRHFRGHGVHSPLVYSLVREVFMHKGFLSENRELFDELVGCGIKGKTARRLQNLSDFMPQYKLHIIYKDQSVDHFEPQTGTMSCVFKSKSNKHLIENHPGMSIDKRSYVLLIHDDNYRKQHFIL